MAAGLLALQQMIPDLAVGPREEPPPEARKSKASGGFGFGFEPHLSSADRPRSVRPTSSHQISGSAPTPGSKPQSPPFSPASRQPRRRRRRWPLCVLRSVQGHRQSSRVRKGPTRPPRRSHPPRRGLPARPGGPSQSLRVMCLLLLGRRPQPHEPYWKTSYSGRMLHQINTGEEVAHVQSCRRDGETCRNPEIAKERARRKRA